MYEITYYRDGQPLDDQPDNRGILAESYGDAVKFAEYHITNEPEDSEPGAVIRKVVYALYRPHAQTSNRIVRVEYNTEIAAEAALDLIPREYNTPREFVRREVVKVWHIGLTEPTE